MRLVTINNLSEFSGVRDAWNNLLAKTSPVPLPLTHAWLRVWWQAFGANSRMWFKCLYENERLVGMAPYMLVKTYFRGIPVTVKKLAVNGHSPFSNIVIDPDLSRDDKSSAYRLLTAVDSFDMVMLPKVATTSAVSGFVLDRECGENALFSCKSALTTPVLNISGDWAKFYASRTRNLRKSLNNKLNRYAREGDFSIVRESIASSDHPALEEMVTVSGNSWKRTIGRDLVTNREGKDFLYGMADALGESGAVNIWVMRKSGVPVAFEYHIECDGVVYPVRADYDERYKNFSPGSILEYTAIKSLFDSHCITQYYTCADDYWYLSNWTTDTVDHVDINIFSRSLKGRSLYSLECKILPSAKKVVSKCSFNRYPPIQEGAK